MENSLYIETSRKLLFNVNEYFQRRQNLGRHCSIFRRRSWPGRFWLLEANTIVIAVALQVVSRRDEEETLVLAGADQSGRSVRKRTARYLARLEVLSLVARIVRVRANVVLRVLIVNIALVAWILRLRTSVVLKVVAIDIVAFVSDSWRFWRLPLGVVLRDVQKSVHAHQVQPVELQVSFFLLSQPILCISSFLAEARFFFLS
jgi:hypothetical protein